MAYTNIDDPSAYFQTKVYTGSNANQSITNDGNSDLQPDWIFASYRTLPPYTNHRVIIDSSRGRAKILESDTTAAEVTTALPAYDLVSFNTNGFTVGAVNSTSSLNASGISHVAWQWKANGGTTSSNTAGSTTTTVQANQDAGFSIVQFTTNGGNATYGHGLGVKPDIVIVKSRSVGGFWLVMTDVIDGSVDYLSMNSTTGAADLPYGAFTSSTFQYNDNNGITQIAYCFAEKQGYSKVGRYVGNGSADGAFVYTGFKPAFIMAKAEGTGYWLIYDHKRIGHNPNNYELYANSNDVEEDNDRMDILSNGFKMRLNNADSNGLASYYIYMAFAENPFTTSTGVPACAR
jgi:hypothetical protein